MRVDIRENDQERGLPNAVGDDSSSATRKKKLLSWGVMGATTIENEAKSAFRHSMLGTSALLTSWI